MCTGPRGERPPPRFAIVGGDRQAKEAEVRRRGLDRRSVLLLEDPWRAHGFAPGGTYVVLAPLLDRDHEILAILRRAGWQQFDEPGPQHVEMSTPDEPGRRHVAWIALHTGEPLRQVEWTEWAAAPDQPLAYHYAPDEIDDGERAYEMDIDGYGEVTIPGGLPAWRNAPRGPVEYRSGGEPDPHEHPEREGDLTLPAGPLNIGPQPWEPPTPETTWEAAIQRGDTIRVQLPDGQEMTHEVTDVRPDGHTVHLSTAPSDGPATPHLSSAASRSAYAAAGALRDAGDARDDDLAWPQEWTWGGPAGPVAALVDEDTIADAIRDGYERDEVEAHAPVYAPGTEPRFEPLYRPGGRPAWLPDVGEVEFVTAATGDDFLRALSGMGEVLDALARVMEAATQAFAGNLDAWRPTGIRGGSPGFVVIDEVHEWTGPGPRVSDVVDTSSLAPDRPLDAQPSVDPVVRISAPLDVDTAVVEALRRGDSIDLSDRRPQAARFSPRLPPGSVLDVRWRR